jgi:protein-S-isoprenylcysteine O-methyltransferase Ste14
VKSRLRAVIVLLVILLVVGIAISYDSTPAPILEVLVALCIILPAVLALKTLWIYRWADRSPFWSSSHLRQLSGATGAPRREKRAAAQL